jgi:flagellar protein FlaJ
MLGYLPLVASSLVVATFLLAPRSGRLDALLSRAAFWLFGGRDVSPDPARDRLLRTAAIGTPYREYVAKTRLYVAGTGVAGAVVGAYLGVGGIVLARSLGVATATSLPSPGVFTNLPETGWTVGPAAQLPAFDGPLFAWLLFASGAVAALASAGAYAARWKLPAVRADTRRRQIDASMPGTVAFVYALTRGGMAFPDVLRTLSRNQAVFGEAAAEVGVAVRNMDLFSVDLVTAVQDLSRRTPSEQFEQFAENLGSVLRSGRNVSAFLEEQYGRYRREAEEQQEEVLALLATTAEVYVTVLVAGMLFLVTILLIIGLTTGDTLFLIRLIAYVVLPLANLLFLAYLAEVTGPLRASRDSNRLVPEQGGQAVPAGPARADGGSASEASRASSGTDTVPDGGYVRPGSKANHERLRAYERFRSLHELLSSPVTSALEQPTLVLYVTVPLAVAVTAYRLPSAFVDGGVSVRVLDDLLVQAVLFLAGSFVAVYEVSKHRNRHLERAVPDLLERLASLNEAGVAVVTSFEQVRSSDVGALDREVERIWRDVRLGATVEQALGRFERRVRTPSITRVVTLVTNAMRASNEISPVLRIAAEQARADQRLRRQRRQEMFTYLVVIYVSFVVFLIVFVSLDYVLIPSLPETGAGDAVGGATNILGGVGGAGTDAYRLAFFHTALVQSSLSGLVGGMMGGGTVKDGVKHSAVMLTVTYVVLTLLA